MNYLNPFFYVGIMFGSMFAAFGWCCDGFVNGLSAMFRIKP